MSASETVILVVDDEPQNIQLLAGLLASDYRVKAAKNGEKALQIAGKSPLPALILLDVMMPDMDGYEVCRRLKADEQTRHIPLVFVTGQVNEVERERGLAMGAVDYLYKPVQAEQLLTCIAQSLGGAA